MAKVSSAPEDAFHFKGAFEEGWGVITGAKALVFQYPPAKESKNGRMVGDQDPPQLVVAFEIERYRDGEGNKIGTPAEEVLLSIQKADKQSGLLTRIRPGNFVDNDPDTDPVDCGGDLGAEGNTLFGDGTCNKCGKLESDNANTKCSGGVPHDFISPAINDKCKYMKFTDSLTEKGFKPAVLKRTFFSDFIGLYAYFKNVTAKTGDYDSNLFVVDKIVRFPYEAGGKGAAAAAPVAAKAAKSAPAATKAKANGAPAPAATATEPAAEAPEGMFTAEDIAQAIVTETLAAAKKGVTMKDSKKLRVEALMCISKHKPTVPPELKKAVQDQLSEDWLLEFGAAVGAFEVQPDGQIRFA